MHVHSLVTIFRNQCVIDQTKRILDLLSPCRSRYGSGIVATKVLTWGEFILAELTRLFDAALISSTSISARLRYQLDRHSDAYRQRVHQQSGRGPGHRAPLPAQWTSHRQPQHPDLHPHRSGVISIPQAGFWRFMPPLARLTRVGTRPTAVASKLAWGRKRSHRQHING